MLKRIVVLMILTITCFMLHHDNLVFADIVARVDTEVYSIYDEDFNLLFQKELVEVGDEYLSNKFKLYEVVYVDCDNHKGLAKFIRNIDMPKVDISYTPKPISTKERKICMYMSHNDESYLNGDGVDSVYGNGGAFGTTNRKTKR